MTTMYIGPSWDRFVFSLHDLIPLLVGDHLVIYYSYGTFLCSIGKSSNELSDLHQPSGELFIFLQLLFNINTHASQVQDHMVCYSCIVLYLHTIICMMYIYIQLYRNYSMFTSYAEIKDKLYMYTYRYIYMHIGMLQK